MPNLSWLQVLAWRMRRQFLETPARDAREVVRRLCGVQAQVASAAELAVAIRLAPHESAATPAPATPAPATPAPAAPAPAAPAAATTEACTLDHGLWHERTLIKTWAMRGTLHVLAAEETGAYLSLLNTVRSWERPSWQKYFGATPPEVETLIEAVGSVLDGRVLTRDELVAEIVERTESAHLADLLRSSWGTLLKPAAWRGRLCYGPPRGSQVTFTRPDTWASGWTGLPDPETAARTVVRAYLSAYGPATMRAFDAWLTRGQSRRATLRGWFDALGDELTTVEVEGEPAFVLAEDVDELAAQQPTRSVRLLPGFDQYILGPGTGDTQVIATERRPQVSRAAGWISAVVLQAGKVAGVWKLENDSDQVDITLFDDVPRSGLDAESERIGRILGRPLSIAVSPHRT